MRTGHVASSRPQYYDRNPVGAIASFGEALTAPHNTTTRFTYTAPTGKKAFIESAFVSAVRRTAAGTPSVMEAYLFHAPVGVGGQVIAYITETQASVGVEKVSQYTGLGFVKASDVLRADTSDASTGGTYQYHIVLWYVEFDA